MTTLDEIRAHSNRDAFPLHVLDGIESAACFYCAAFLGRQDVIHVVDAPKLRELFLVDLDFDRLELMRERYRFEIAAALSTYCGDAFETAARIREMGKQVDLLTIDPWCGPDMDAVLARLPEFAALAKKWLVVGCCQKWLDASADDVRKRTGVEAPVEMRRRGADGAFGTTYWLVFDMTIREPGASRPTRPPALAAGDRVATPAAPARKVVDPPLASLAMICLIRDEAELRDAARAVKSVGPACDEVVIVLDDRSMERSMIYEFTSWDHTVPVRIVRRPWPGFAAQRNEAASLCRGKFVVVCDGDDYFRDLGDLRALIESAPDDVDVIACENVNENEHGVEASRHPQWVAYRRDRCHWERGTHNQLVGAKKSGSSTAVLVSIYDSRRVRERFERAVGPLLAEAEKNPSDVHTAYFLAQTYGMVGDWPNVEKWAAKTIELAPDDPHWANAYEMRFKAALSRTLSVDAATEVLIEGLEHHPRHRGLLRWQAYVALARWSLEESAPDSPYVMNENTSARFHAHLPRAAELLGFPIRAARPSEVGGTLSAAR
jgi:hypothetical protein